MGRRRGFFAQIQHSIREAERGERRRQREAVTKAHHAMRVYKAQATANALLTAEARKAAEREAAETAADGYRAQMDLLVSVHRACTARVDWAANAEARRPIIAAVDETPIAAARAAIEGYRPSLITRLLKREAKQRARLTEDLQRAEARVEAARSAAAAGHTEAVAEWEEGVAFAERVLAQDLATYDEVVTETNCFAELEELGCGVSVTWLSPSVGRVSIRAQEKDVVPTEEKNVTAKGQPSVKKLPAAKVSAVYQDFVCGSALRAARELFAVLPLRAVLVDVWTSLLNKATGHFEDAPILSVYCPQEQFERVNFDRVDASDLVTTLRHEMLFSKTKGLAAVTPLAGNDFLGHA